MLQPGTLILVLDLLDGETPQGDGSRDGVCDAVPITVCAQAGNGLDLSASLCYHRAEHRRRAFRPARFLLANKITIGGRPP
jgi:hypothetical protein